MGKCVFRYFTSAKKPLVLGHFLVLRGAILSGSLTQRIFLLPDLYLPAMFLSLVFWQQMFITFLGLFTFSVFRFHSYFGSVRIKIRKTTNSKNDTYVVLLLWLLMGLWEHPECPFKNQNRRQSNSYVRWWRFGGVGGGEQSLCTLVPTWGLSSSSSR